MKEKKFTIYQLTFIGLMTAVLCVLSPWSVSIGPIPLSLATMVIYFTVYVIGEWAGTASVCLYILLGVTGLPVFSGGAGGLGKIAGPTGGYIVGYIFMALLGGLFIRLAKRNIWLTMLGWVAATAVLYAIGTAWYIYLTKSTLQHALLLCVYPFLPGDAVKIIAGTLIGKAVHVALVKANILQ